MDNHPNGNFQITQSQFQGHEKTPQGSYVPGFKGSVHCPKGNPVGEWIDREHIFEESGKTDGGQIL